MAMMYPAEFPCLQINAQVGHKTATSCIQRNYQETCTQDRLNKVTLIGLY